VLTAGRNCYLFKSKPKVAYLRYDLPEDNTKMTNNWFKESAVPKYKKMFYLAIHKDRSYKRN
jgi:hypothetical protein